MVPAGSSFMDYFIKDPLVPLSVILHVSRILHIVLRTKNQDQLAYLFPFHVSILYRLPRQQTQKTLQSSIL